MTHRKLFMTIGCSLVLLLGAIGVGQVAGDQHVEAREETPSVVPIVEHTAAPTAAPAAPPCTIPADLAATLDAGFAALDVPQDLTGVEAAAALAQHDPCAVVALIHDLLTCEDGEDCRCVIDVVLELVEEVREWIQETVEEVPTSVEAVDAEVGQVLNEVPAVTLATSPIEGPVASAPEVEADVVAPDVVPDVQEEVLSVAPPEDPVPALGPTVQPEPSVVELA